MILDIRSCQQRHPCVHVFSFIHMNFICNAIRTFHQIRMVRLQCSCPKRPSILIRNHCFQICVIVLTVFQRNRINTIFLAYHGPFFFIVKKRNVHRCSGLQIVRCGNLHLHLSIRRELHDAAMSSHDIRKYIPLLRINPLYASGNRRGKCGRARSVHI